MSFTTVIRPRSRTAANLPGKPFAAPRPKTAARPILHLKPPAGA